MTTSTDDSQPADAAAGAEAELSIVVQSGEPTAEELAALSAVVQAAYLREAADALAGEPRGMSAWAVSQRALRAPLRRELGWNRSAW